MGLALLKRLTLRYTMNTTKQTAIDTFFILLYKNKNTQSFERKPLKRDDVASAMLSGYKVIDDFEGRTNGVSARYVVMSRRVSVGSWLEYKALKLKDMGFKTVVEPTAKALVQPTAMLEKPAVAIKRSAPVTRNYASTINKALIEANRSNVKAAIALQESIETCEDFGTDDGATTGYFEDSFVGHK
jgi:hypothetical protein